jgi:hypothetical protein
LGKTHLNKERSLKGIGVVEIRLGALLNGQMRQIAVVRIVVKECNTFTSDNFQNCLGDGRFAGAGS